MHLAGLTLTHCRTSVSNLILWSPFLDEKLEEELRPNPSFAHRVAYLTRRVIAAPDLDL